MSRKTASVARRMARKGTQKPDTTEYVYRGVHADHPEIEAARMGVVRPGNPNGLVTPDEHNIGEPGTSADSPFTSWTFDLVIARAHANRYGPGGLILRVPYSPPPPGAGWSWQQSRDRLGESEVLMRGQRSGCTVMLCVR